MAAKKQPSLIFTKLLTQHLNNSYPISLLTDDECIGLTQQRKGNHLNLASQRFINPTIIWACYTKFGHKTSKYPHT